MFTSFVFSHRCFGKTLTSVLFLLGRYLGTGGNVYGTPPFPESGEIRRISPAQLFSFLALNDGTQNGLNFPFFTTEDAETTENFFCTLLCGGENR